MAWGQQYVDASLAAIVLAVMPLTTVAVAPLIISTETWTFSKWAGFILGFIGIAVLTGVDALKYLGGDTMTIIAQMALLLAAVSYGVGAVFVQRLGRVDPLAAATIQNFIACFLLLPFALVLDQPWTLQPSLSSLIAFTLTGVFATGFASVGFFLLVRTAGAAFMALTAYISPLWAVFFAMIVLGERPGPNAFVALVLILVGMGFTQVRPGVFASLLGRRV
jgi:drug/metabolite transporter (DMT)-like permease